jgi:hypothetical protein
MNNAIRQGNMLWWNQGGMRFLNVAGETQTLDGGWGWSAKFLDYDNDGDLDIFTVNGFVSAGPVDVFKTFGQFWGLLSRADVSDARTWPDLRGLSMSGFERSRLFENRGGRFVEIAAGAGLADNRDGRGIAAGDFDEDGDVDLVVTTAGGKAALYRNDGENGNRWLTVTLQTARGHSAPIGARLTLQTGHLTQIREIDAGNGFSGQSSKVVHFGLARVAEPGTLTIRWPSGSVQRIEPVVPNQRITITEPEAEGRR